jgi:predicted house-cleaning NTP pyrophosphatase (Maf/HAM1 superfamily)
MSSPPAPPLLLASTSPQRTAILHQLGIPHDVVAPHYEEHDPPDADPVALVERLGTLAPLATAPDDYRRI